MWQTKLPTLSFKYGIVKKLGLIVDDRAKYLAVYQILSEFFKNPS